MAITHQPRTGAAESSTEEASQTIREAAARTQEKAQAVADEQKGALADELHSIGRAFHKTGDSLRDEGKASAADLTERVGQYADQLGQALHEKRLGDLMHDLEDVARQRPMLVLGGAALAGFALTRFFRSSGRPPQESYAEESYAEESYAEGDFPSTSAFEGSALAGEPSHGQLDPDDSRLQRLP